MLKIAPFNVANLYEAGYNENWPRLRSVLEPIVNPLFAVTDLKTQYLVDTVRRLFDASVDSIGEGAIWKIALAQERGNGTLEMLLSVGVDPDLPKNDAFRLSHVCGQEGWRETAGAVFLCRPDMAALTKGNCTPLAAAQARYKARLLLRSTYPTPYSPS
jgi:hypothetical protein